MASKASLPRGTRDILPNQMIQREWIMDSLKSSFRSYGFQAIETPAMEKLETLTGKYGEEGDRLIFKLLPRGEKLEKVFRAEDLNSAREKLNRNLEEALRYDLTVPLARFVVQNQNEINFPFKRYQIQPVWRADRPAKGRYREFYQCDADVIGSKSLWQEVDFIGLYSEVFAKLGLPIEIKMNHRKVLQGITEKYGVNEHFGAFTVALDKLDKIGLAGVQKEMTEKDLPEGALKALELIHNLKGDNRSILNTLKEELAETEVGIQGLGDLNFVVEACADLNIGAALQLDFTLARGLDYYTGAIFEVKALDLDLGSIGGGGRYDDLTSIFGLKNMPGIGISFGLDRIQLALEEKGISCPEDEFSGDFLFVNFGEKEARFSNKLAKQLRGLGLKVELYPDATKMKKQLDYANRKGIRFVLLIGSEEMEQGIFTLKDMKEGSQRKLGTIELLEAFNPSQSQDHAKH
ncbi:MAG: histidine--tRNA ligase [Bacteroidetes bacterium]|nr:histidine--tRNA ligase [Bacteroidota bacterium]